ncbi:MAG: HPr family phosphocarrier protein [Gammaproteobacteria bacterium]|jgi:phosphocarrier protein HPr
MTSSIELEIINRLGLHARACAKMVKTAAHFESAITLSDGKSSADAKSIMHLMMLAASQGTRITLSAEGSDSDQAIGAIRQLIQDRFGEDE